MDRIGRLSIIIGLLLSACMTGKVNVIQPNDKTPPVVKLDVTTVDPETDKAHSVNVEGSSTDAGSTQSLTAKAGQVIIHASAKDPSGVQKLTIWNIGAPLVNMAKGEIVNGPNNAFSSVSTIATMNAAAGEELGVFATARNFYSGTELEPSTAFTPLVTMDAEGSLAPLPVGTKEKEIIFTWSDAKKAYVAPGAAAPAPGAKVVAVTVGNPFGGGALVSLYRGSGNIDALDLRKDFVRMFQNSRASFFLGPWSSQPWYALRNIYRTKGFANQFTIEVHWVP